MQELGLIAIAGIVGVGKTTLARNLAKALSAHLIEELYDRNPFLARQYAGDSQAALASQLFFLLSRIDQLHPAKLADYPTAVADYIYQKDRLFARLNLNQQQFVLYEQIADALTRKRVLPNIVIYLHDSVENCLARIANRGRDFEQNIDPGWLGRLSEAYDLLFENWEQECEKKVGDAHPKFIRIDCAQHDIRDKDVLDALIVRLTGQLECNHSL
jgi:deoxyadenosine/deoxycytidine kinase